MNNHSDKLDHEWVTLIKEALELGYTYEEIKDYIQAHSQLNKAST
ncbi:anti-repressor SinI family protein [Halalkalibacter okhensis]|nr:anti-repressor SinI family protein [Halalkalibacter okhensis]